MISRRAFLAGAGACLCGSSIISSVHAQSEEDFICSSVDPPLSVFDVDDFAVAAGTSPSVINDAVVAARQDLQLTDYGTAFLPQRWRKQDGIRSDDNKITLGIYFIGGTESQRSTVRAIAPGWLNGDLGRYIAFRFDVPRDQSQIRIAFDPKDGNNSVVGRENMKVPKSKKTMNLAQVSRRSVLHEFGHALGLKHEHMHPASGIQWNEQYVIDAMKSSQNWDPATTRANILTKYNIEAACIGDPKPNRQSIMMYPIPKGWAKNFSVGLNTNISQRDINCLVGLYRVGA